MMLSDHEWLRFVSFALIAGGVLGALWTGAYVAAGRTLVGALVRGVLATAVIALLFHGVARWLISRALAGEEPREEGGGSEEVAADG
jgi:hypothetical protein